MIYVDLESETYSATFSMCIVIDSTWNISYIFKVLHIKLETFYTSHTHTCSHRVRSSVCYHTMLERIKHHNQVVT
jgi:hypothetical protein